MAISSPNVIRGQKRDALDYLSAGMQFGSMLKQQQMVKDQQDLESAKVELEMLDKAAETAAGGWAGMMKNEKMQDTVAGLYGKLGYPPDVAKSMAQNLGTVLPSTKASMDIANVTMAHYGKTGQPPTPEQYREMLPDQDKGEVGQTSFAGDITGTTYKWQEKKVEEDQQVTPGKEQQKTVPGTAMKREDLEKMQSGINPAAGGFRPELSQQGQEYYRQKYANVPVDAPLMYDPEQGKKEAEKFQTEQQAKKYSGQATAGQPEIFSEIPAGESATVISVDTPPAAAQKKTIVDKGQWEVVKKNESVGTVQDGRFTPNNRWAWTNEKEMWRGMSSQVWGEKGEDVQAFKEMVYDNAKSEGFKGSFDDFFNPKKGKKLKHSWMPKGYSWIQKNGINLTNPEEITPVKAVAMSTEIPTSRKKFMAKAAERANTGVNKVINEMNQKLYPDSAPVPGKYSPTGPKVEGQMGVTTPGAAPISKQYGPATGVAKQVEGMLTWDEVKEYQKVMDNFISPYGKHFENRQVYYTWAKQQKRIYENLGGEKIMDVLAPNAAELERARLDADMSRSNAAMTLETERLLKDEKLGLAELELKRVLGMGQLGVDEQRAELEKILASPEYALQMGMVKQKMAEAQGVGMSAEQVKVMDVGVNMMNQGRQVMDKQFDQGATWRDLMANKILYTGWLTYQKGLMLSQGQDPTAFAAKCEYWREKDPGMFVRIVTQNLLPVPEDVPIAPGSIVQGGAEQRKQVTVEEQMAADEEELRRMESGAGF